MKKDPQVGGSASNRVDQSALSVFDFNENPLRVLMHDDEPWFVAADVCRALDHSNARVLIAELDEDEKMTVSNPYGHSAQRGGARSYNLISESGLYALVFKSRKPEAKSFRKWVTSEVLPAIRKTGTYKVPEFVATPIPRVRTVRDQMMSLRDLLLAAASAVQMKTLDVGRAQQLANLSGRYLETIKLEGDASGYETLFEMQAGEAGDRLLQAEGGGLAKPL